MFWEKLRQRLVRYISAGIADSERRFHRLRLFGRGARTPLSRGAFRRCFTGGHFFQDQQNTCLAPGPFRVPCDSESRCQNNTRNCRNISEMPHSAPSMCRHYPRTTQWMPVAGGGQDERRRVPSASHDYGRWARWVAAFSCSAHARLFLASWKFGFRRTASRAACIASSHLFMLALAAARLLYASG